MPKCSGLRQLPFISSQFSRSEIWAVIKWVVFLLTSTSLTYVSTVSWIWWLCSDVCWLLVAFLYMNSQSPAGWHRLSPRAALGFQIEQKGKRFPSLCMHHICCWFLTNASPDVSQLQGGEETD